MVVIGFHNLILEVISHHFCHTCTRPVVIQGERTVQGSGYQDAGIIGSHSEAAYHNRRAGEGNVWKEWMKVAESVMFLPLLSLIHQVFYSSTQYVRKTEEEARGILSKILPPGKWKGGEWILPPTLESVSLRGTPQCPDLRLRYTPKPAQSPMITERGKQLPRNEQFRKFKVKCEAGQVL